MATLPDHRTLKTWEDAFASPIPLVRQLEKQIRHDISTNRSRLRSLVGGSYRDLLATAETISDMDKRMRGLESVLSDDIGRKCNTGMLERTKTRSKALMDEAAAPTTRNYAVAAQMSVFRACPGAILRILRTTEGSGSRAGSLLTAAKMLVISRVLYTKKLKDERRFAGTVRATFDRLGSIRGKLLMAIEGRIAGIEAPDALLDAMSAYALATTSSAADILRHFHNVRATAMTEALTVEPADPVRALRIWLQTLRDTQAVFPRQLVAALNQLKAKPLLAGADLIDIAAFDLEVHGSWLGDDIKGFVPYVRHDDLDLATAKKQLSSWAPASLQGYLKDLRTSLEAIEDIPTVAKLRRECLSAWFASSGRLAGVPRSDVLDGLRKTFAERLVHLTETRCRALFEVSSMIKKTLEKWGASETSTSAPNLWDAGIYTTELAHGGKKFTNNLQASFQGRSHAGDSILQAYRIWLSDIERIEKTIQDERKVRWQDLSEDYEDDSDEDESREQTLSKDDPDALQKKLTDAVVAALDTFQDSLRASSQAVQDATNKHDKAAFLLRLVREFQALLPSSYTKAFGADFKMGLYQSISEPVIQRVLEKHGTKVEKSLQNKKLPVRELWAESTGLPTLPSPWAFRLLRTCQSTMEAAGQDLWGVSVVAELKRSLVPRLQEKLAAARKLAIADNTDAEGGEDSKENAPDKSEKLALRDVFTQQLFDTKYLAAALTSQRTSGSGSEELAQHCEWLLKNAELPKDTTESITRNAEEYWKRTSLLFALLA